MDIGLTGRTCVYRGSEIVYAYLGIPLNAHVKEMAIRIKVAAAAIILRVGSMWIAFFLVMVFSVRASGRLTGK